MHHYTKFTPLNWGLVLKHPISDNSLCMAFNGFNCGTWYVHNSRLKSQVCVGPSVRLHPPSSVGRAGLLSLSSDLHTYKHTPTI